MRRAPDSLRCAGIFASLGHTTHSNAPLPTHYNNELVLRKFSKNNGPVRAILFYTWDVDNKKRV